MAIQSAHHSFAALPHTQVNPNPIVDRGILMFLDFIIKNEDANGIPLYVLFVSHDWHV
jgi:hypothetical protein